MEPICEIPDRLFFRNSTAVGSLVNSGSGGGGGGGWEDKFPTIASTNSWNNEHSGPSV